tara:strand:+ start:765 stop:1019 length:255 start_codon:yes stop_codon:yes gene_type:complete
MLTPMIAKMSITREQTTTTFDIDGMDASNAFTTSFIPSSFEMTLSGLSALNALRAFKACSDCMSILRIMKIRSMTEALTTNPSS